ncbi:MAG: [Fe-Fe] hydrogenase large subunit C-terminal domain-containing protein, partial [Tannerellaceae bacterium]
MTHTRRTFFKQSLAGAFLLGTASLAQAGTPDVDAVLTTRELAKMIKQAGIDFLNLPDEDFDEPMG